MLFGQSLFQSVLERLKAEAIDAEDDVERAYRVRGLGASFIAEEVRGAAADMERGRALYREIMEDTPAAEPDAETPEPVEAAPPPHLIRLAPEEVAADLGLKATDSLGTLAEKRRAFARLNHPDRVAPAFRDMATARMKIANLLVDEAIRLQQG